MKKVNLRDYYPFYTSDCSTDVSDEVAAALMDAERLERNYARRMFWNKAHYSLDADDGIEHDALSVPLPPHEVYERKFTTEQLHAAIASLPGKQCRRVYAHYILGIGKAEIARAEGVGKSSISESINRGLRNMEIYLKKML